MTNVNYQDQPRKADPESGGQNQRVVSVLKEYDGRQYLEFSPNGYSYPIALPVIQYGTRDKANAWTWNGSIAAPTLKPSIRTGHSSGLISHLWLNWHANPVIKWAQ